MCQYYTTYFSCGCLEGIDWDYCNQSTSKGNFCARREEVYSYGLLERCQECRGEVDLAAKLQINLEVAKVKEIDAEILTMAEAGEDIE